MFGNFETDFSMSLLLLSRNTGVLCTPVSAADGICHHEESVLRKALIKAEMMEHDSSAPHQSNVASSSTTCHSCIIRKTSLLANEIKRCY